MFARLRHFTDLNVILGLVAFSIPIAGQVATASGVKHAPTLRVKVQDPAGNPLTNVVVVCIGQETNAALKGCSIEGGGKRLTSDSQGLFDLECDGSNIALMVASDKGFCLAQSGDLTTNHDVLVVQPWGRIEGVRTDNKRLLSNHRLSLEIIGRCVDPLVSNSIDLNDETTTDSRGRFVFEHVPPVEVWLQDVQVWLGAQTNREPTVARVEEIDMQPGQTQHVEISTHGRTVVGRIELAQELAGTIDSDSLDESLGRGLNPDGFDFRKRTWVPAEFDTAEQRAKWYLEWFNTDAGRQRKDAITRIRSIMIHADGSFVAKMVEPGKYVLDGNLRKNRKTVALLDHLHFVVPFAQPGEDPQGRPYVESR
jgi:hypothetical protein